MCKTINGNCNGNGGGEKWDLCSKKKNNQNNKPRQRGLGIAKLEKILREEKDKEENRMVVAEFFSSLHLALPCSINYRLSLFSIHWGGGGGGGTTSNGPSPTNTLPPTPNFFRSFIVMPT